MCILKYILIRVLTKQSSRSYLWPDGGDFPGTIRPTLNWMDSGVVVGSVHILLGLSFSVSGLHWWTRGAGELRHLSSIQWESVDIVFRARQWFSNTWNGPTWGRWLQRHVSRASSVKSRYFLPCSVSVDVVYGWFHVLRLYCSNLPKAWGPAQIPRGLPQRAQKYLYLMQRSSN